MGEEREGAREIKCKIMLNVGKREKNLERQYFACVI
jgi:hypothetical protein